jgi:hypothetical protein
MLWRRKNSSYCLYEDSKLRREGLEYRKCKGLYSLKSITCLANGQRGPLGSHQLTCKDCGSMWIIRVATHVYEFVIQNHSLRIIYAITNGTKTCRSSRRV